MDNNIILALLQSNGFEVELITENNILATYGDNIVLALTRRPDGCYAAKAMDITKKEFLDIYTKSNNYANTGIGWFAYQSNIPASDHLHINNHDHSYYELEMALRYLSKEVV